MAGGTSGKGISISALGRAWKLHTAVKEDRMFRLLHQLIR